MCRLANVLSDSGVAAGDVVALYMPVSPLAVATMLATSRLGAVHNVVFAGFSSRIQLFLLRSRLDLLNYYKISERAKFR